MAGKADMTAGGTDGRAPAAPGADLSTYALPRRLFNRVGPAVCGRPVHTGKGQAAFGAVPGPGSARPSVAWPGRQQSNSCRPGQGPKGRDPGPDAAPHISSARRLGPTVLTVLALFFAVVLGDPAAALAGHPVRLLVLGDSLTAGYGLPPEETFPAQLQAKLRSEGLDVKVVNGGVSGDTTAGGRARLDWMLADGKPDAAIVELGANDALRGIDPAVTRANLDAIVGRLKKAGVCVLLAGMLAPPNYGRDYQREFRAIYPAVASAHDVALYPFFLDGVVTVKKLNQGDGNHPNAAGVAEIVDRIAPYVVRLVRKAG